MAYYHDEHAPIMTEHPATSSELRAAIAASRQLREELQATIAASRKRRESFAQERLSRPGSL